jgi:multiple sugar transport system substrate-binding protein
VQGSRALFINRELFRRAGLNPDHAPETWDELLAAAQRISSLGTGIYGFGQNIGERYVLYKKFMAFAWGNGGDVFDETGTVVLNSPAVLEALEFYLRLAPYSLQEKQEVLDQYFKTGRLGMQISGAWNLKNYKLEAPTLDYSVALVPKPAADRGAHMSFAGAEMLVVFKASERNEAALELARFLQAYPQARKLSLAAGSVFPAARAAMNDPAFTSDPRVRVFVEQSLTSRTTPAHPGWIEMEEAIDRAVEESLYGRRAPRWCLDDAAKEVQEIAARFPRKPGP